MRPLAFASLVVLCCHACASFGTAADVSDGGTDAATVDVADASGASSCRALLAQSPALHGKNGIYEIVPGDAGAVRVYCEMTLDDGGWTLAGRSGVQVPGGQLPFGWSSATGSVDSPALPYSLDVVAHQITFVEVLVASQDSTRAYKFAVTPAFLETAAGATTPTGTLLTVAGDCGAPPMLKFAAPALTEVFFFRDIPDLGQKRGLTPGGFDLSYRDECRGGLLDGVQGVIMVR